MQKKMRPFQTRIRAVATGLLLLAMVTMPLHLATAGSKVDDDFTKDKDLKEWRLRCGNHYGIDVKKKKTDVGLTLSPLITTKGPYLTYGRPIKLKEGDTYKLSFEARAERGNYSVGIGERASIEDYTRHLHKKMKASTDFQTHEFEFVAKPPPVAGAKAEKKGTKKPKEFKDHQPHISFLLGSAAGSFEIKWLKLVEVEGK